MKKSTERRGELNTCKVLIILKITEILGESFQSSIFKAWLEKYQGLLDCPDLKVLWKVFQGCLQTANHTCHLHTFKCYVELVPQTPCRDQRWAIIFEYIVTVQLFPIYFVKVLWNVLCLSGRSSSYTYVWESGKKSLSYILMQFSRVHLY